MTSPLNDDAGLLELSNGIVEVKVTTAFGPRLLHAGLVDGENLMVQLPDAKLEWRDGEKFSLRGGHRLWVAPEVRALTYTPDDAPVEAINVDGGVLVATGATASSPFRRDMEIRLTSDKPEVRLTHRLTYEGESTAVAAPWAITMLPADGVVILPMRRGSATQLQADRNIVLWPYANLDDPLLEITNDAIVIHGGRTTPTKVGTSGVAGWGAYVRGGTALIKRAIADPSASYPDKGAGLQCYANQQFMELETLGPLRTLQPGESAEHVETWELRPLDTAIESAESLLERLEEALAP